MKLIPQNRREFLRSGLRYGLLGGAIVLARILTGREGACPVSKPCRQCAALAQCELPQALKLKGSSSAQQ